MVKHRKPFPWIGLIGYAFFCAIATIIIVALLAVILEIIR